MVPGTKKKRVKQLANENGAKRQVKRNRSSSVNNRQQSENIISSYEKLLKHRESRKAVVKEKPVVCLAIEYPS